MAKVDKKEIDKKTNGQYEDLNRVLGNPNEVYVGEKIFKMNHISMENFAEFMKHIMNISYSSLWVNYLDDEAPKSLSKIMELSFENEDVNNIMKNINAENFSEIMKKIIDLNGIELQTEKGTGDSKAKKD